MKSPTKTSALNGQKDAVEHAYCNGNQTRLTFMLPCMHEVFVMTFLKFSKNHIGTGSIQ